MQKDNIIRGTGKIAEFRFVLVDATRTLSEIGKAHGAKGSALELLAETAVSSILMASNLKSGGVVHVQYNYDGDVSYVQADATPLGLVRAMLPQNEAQSSGSFDISQSPKNMIVRKFNENGKKLQESITSMVSQRPAQNMAAYQLDSEQIKSAVGIQAKADEDGRLKYCVGFLVESFPKIDDPTLSALEENIKTLPDLDEYWSENQGFDMTGLMAHLTRPFEIQIHREFEVKAYCPCNEHRLKNSLKSLGRTELNNLILGGETLEIFCDFCRKRYEFTQKQLFQLLDSMEN